MWLFIKILNLIWVLATTNMWPTALHSSPYLQILVNALMIVSLGLMPFKISFGAAEGRILLATIALTVWSLVTDEVGMGVTIVCSCLPVMYLTQFPYEYLKDLLHFVTKWLAILLVPALLLYWVLLFVNLPSLGTLTHPNYEPYLNYIFYIKTTFDYGTFVRFNAFFLEPGHLSLLCTFLIMANRYQFKRCPWLWILLVSIIFSFSLAGYVLTAIGYLFININSIGKLLAAIGLAAAFVAGVLYWNGGDNPMNELIISRLEYDETSGIKGNNRFFDNTDFEYSKALGTKYFWISVKGRANMELIGGAGYKIYILQFGMIGVILALLFYLSVIPPKPDWRFTLCFLCLYILCFFQRAYPLWFSWLFPYVVGLYLAKGEKDSEEQALEINNLT
ncbi:MAG: hypothetical protein K2L00_09320, partial [Muribaculaceae bacterium]|nr:hypothetical protein [Muribaculaceae bacterium]